AGATVNITATVVGTGNVPAVGTVQFFDNGLAVGSPITLNGAGKAVLAFTTHATQLAGDLTPGVHSITAVFTPTGNFLTSTNTLNQTVQANAFGTGNQLVYRVGNGTAAWNVNTGTSIFVDEYTPAGTLVQSLALPTVDQGNYRALVQNGQQSTTGQLSL